MKFSAFSIKNQEFNKAVRGFDKEEVKAFLEKLADEFESLASENEKLKKELLSQQDQLLNFKKIEKNLQNTLLNATESSSKAVESTKKQTALMIKEAELKGSQILEKAKEQANMVRDSVLKLREERNLLIARLKAMVETQSNILDYNLSEKAIEHVQRIEKTPVKQVDINVDEIVEKLL